LLKARKSRSLSRRRRRRVSSEPQCGQACGDRGGGETRGGKSRATDPSRGTASVFRRDTFRRGLLGGIGEKVR